MDSRLQDEVAVNVAYPACLERSKKTLLVLGIYCSTPLSVDISDSKSGFFTLLVNDLR